jgi:putative ABC transport system ATP-binding protein
MKKIPVIELINITKDYITDEITTKVLHGITCTFHKGDFIAITGPSGSGKSTLLNILGLLDTATTGKYIFNTIDVTQLTEDHQAYIRNKDIGFVFQSFNLLKRISVLENVILPAIYTGTKKRIREAKAKELLETVGIADHMDKKPNQLSGGQQQRVAIARALMNDPAIILADEPTGNLDTKSGEEIMQLLKKLNKQGITVLMITHEQDIAEQAQEIITIKDGVII